MRSLDAINLIHTSLTYTCQCVCSSASRKRRPSCSSAARAAWWANSDVGVSGSYGFQGVGPDTLHHARIEPRVKYGTIRRRRRLKTGVGLLLARMATKGNPLKGPVARGLRLEQRIRLSKALKLVGNYTRFAHAGKSAVGQEMGHGKSVEAVFKPKTSIEGREFTAGWNSMTVRSACACLLQLCTAVSAFISKMGVVGC